MSQSSSNEIFATFYWNSKRTLNEWSMQCRICSTRIRGKHGVMSNFHRHIRLKHAYALSKRERMVVQQENEASELIQTCTDFRSKETENKSKANKYNRLHERQVAITSGVINHLVAGGMYPIRLVESDDFIKLMEAADPQYSVPSRRTITRRINSNLQLMKDGIRNDLEQLRKEGQLQGNIHATIDMWSGSKPIIGVKFHYFINKFTLVSKTVAFRQIGGRHTGENLGTVFKDILSEFGIQTNEIGCVITDNAQNMMKAFSLFMTPNISKPEDDDNEDEIQDLCFSKSAADDVKDVGISLHSSSQLSCILHTLQLVIKDGLKSASLVEQIIKECNDVCVFFGRSAYWKEQLTKSTDDLAFLAAVPTRWDNLLTMLRRISQVDVWTALNNMLSQARTSKINTPCLTVERLQLLDLMGLLERFQVAILALQEDNVTISLVIPAILGIEAMMSKYKTQFTDFQWALRCSLHNRFHKIVCQPEYVVATILDCRFKLLPFTQFGMSEVVSDPPHLSTVTACEARTELKKMMDACPVSAYSESADAASPTVPKSYLDPQLFPNSIFSWCYEIVNDYTEEAAFTNTPTNNESPDVFWARSTSGEKFPRLQWIARHLLSIPASSGSVERLFSISNAIISARRNRLTASTMESMLLMRETMKT